MASTTKHGKTQETELQEVSIPIPPSMEVPSNSIEMDSQILQKISCPSPEISISSSNAKPPQYTASQSSLTRRTSTFKGRPKSRFGEPSVPIDSKILEKLGSGGLEPETTRSDSGVSVDHATATPKAKKEEENEKKAPDENEIYSRVTAQLSARNFRKTTVKLVLELLVFSVILGLLVCSLTVDGFKGKMFHGLESWKWFLLLMVIFSGLLLTHWVVRFIVFLIEWKFLLRKNVVYFTHGLKDGVKVFIWLGAVLCTWLILYRPDIKRATKSEKMVDFLTWTLVSLFIGSFLWLVKTTLIKLLASSFHCDRFFDRIRESVFHHYVLQMLSGRPLVELARKLSRENSHKGQVSFTEHTDKGKKVVDWEKLHQMKKEKVPSWTMHLLADVISNSGLTTMSSLLEKDIVEGDVELDNDEITSEEEAIATAVRIFHNVVRDKDNKSYIDRSDLLRFMIMEEVDLVYPLFEVDEKGRISLKAFSKWVVKVYKDRKALQHALNDNKTAVKQLNQLLTAILIILTIILWLLLTEIATMKIVLFFSSQLVVAAFIFGNTCKTIFEAIIFVFVMHPFDVGDRCVIDGTMMVVEEMNIFTTVFLKFDKEKVYYPNAVLATKAIGNYYRSPDQGDSLEFAIDYTTQLSTIAKLKERIKLYLEQNQSFWQLDHNLAVREIENMNKIKMALFFNHTMNFQDFAEKTRRRSELVLQMKTIFDELEIKYHLLPQEVHLCNMTTNIS